MIALYVLCGIIALIVLILCMPLYFSVEYSDEVKINFRFLFIDSKKMKPKEEKPEEEKPKEEPKKEEEEPKEKKPNKMVLKLKAYLKYKGFKGIMAILGDILKTTSKMVWNILKKIRIKELDLYAVVGGSNASDIAIEYGKACSVIYPAVTLIKKICKSPKKPKVTVDADYSLGESKVICTAEVYIRPIFVLGAAFPLVKTVIKYIIDFQKGSKL